MNFMKQTTILSLLITFIMCHSLVIAQAQGLDKATEQQLEINIRKQLEDFYMTTGGYAKNTSEEGAKEQLQSRLLLYAQNPKVAVYNDITASPELLAFEDYFSKLRAKYGNNPAAYLREIDLKSLQRRPINIVGDSLTVEVFFNETLPANQQVPISMVFSARKAQDAGSKYPYFTRLKINSSKRLPAPAEAIAFTSATVNPYQTFLDEQSLSAVIEQVAAGIVGKIPASASAVQVSRFSYAGCHIYDTFAREFSVTLATKLSSLRPNVQFSTEGSQAQTYELRGQYKTQGDKLGIVAELYDPANKSLAQTANADLPLKWFDANKVGFIPPDYERTAQEQLVITQSMAGVSDNLTVKLNTNKGRNGLLFKNKEPMSFYVETNRPCTIRLMYRDVNQKLILIKERKLNNEDCNRSVELETFTCIEPFGRESIVCVATTDCFEPLLTRDSKMNAGTNNEFSIIHIDNSYQDAIRVSTKPCERGIGKSTGKPNFSIDVLEVQTVEQ